MMKIDRSLDSALEAIKSSASEKTSHVAEQSFSEDLLKVGFENQFQKGETSRIKHLINDLLDEYMQNNR
jgi:hypothetical protein